MGKGYMKANHDPLGWTRSKVRLVLRGRYLLRGRLRVEGSSIISKFFIEG